MALSNMLPLGLIEAAQNKPQARSASSRLGGLFGRAMRGVRRFATPDNLQVIGHTLQEIGGQRGALDDYLADRDERAAALRREQQAQAQRDMLEKAIAGMTPQQQMLARLDPSSFVRSILEQPQQEWERSYRERALAQDQSQFEASQATTRRGQDVDLYATQMRQPAQWIPRGPDASLLTGVSNAGIQASEGLSLLDQFEQANQAQATGMGSDIVGYFDPRMSSMRQTGSLIQTMIAPQGQGQVSNYERELFAQGAPNVNLTGTQNQERIRNLRRVFEIRQARAEFYDQYGQTYGTLRGAEEAFQRSERFQSLVPRGRRQQQRGGQQPRVIELEPDGH